MANKHKHKLNYKCIYLTQYRQFYRHTGYDQPAEYCPLTYYCARPGVGQFPANYPHCDRCVNKKEKNEQS